MAMVESLRSRRGAGPLHVQGHTQRILRVLTKRGTFGEEGRNNQLLAGGVAILERPVFQLDATDRDPQLVDTSFGRVDRDRPPPCSATCHPRALSSPAFIGARARLLHLLGRISPAWRIGRWRWAERRKGHQENLHAAQAAAQQSNGERTPSPMT
jgi:hypothetical protein